MPLKDGWRHVGQHDYVNAQHASSLKAAAPRDHPPGGGGGGTSSSSCSPPPPTIYPTFNRSGCSHPAGKLHDRTCACSMSDLDMEKVPLPQQQQQQQKQQQHPSQQQQHQHRTYENTGATMVNADGSLKAFRTYTPKRPGRSVHFSPDGRRGGGGGGDVSGRQTLPASLGSSSSKSSSSSSSSSSSREPRFHPQFQSSRPRSNPAQPSNAVCDYVNMGGDSKGGGGGGGGGGVSSGGGLSPTEGGAPRLYGDLGEFYGSGRRELTGDSLNDSADTADEGNTTTTSGSYTIDQEDNMQDLQSDIFV